MQRTALQALVFSGARFAVLAGFCLVASGCASVNIPLPSLWSSKSDDIETGSIAAAPAAGKAESGTFSNLLPDFAKPKTTEAKKPDDKPFSLEAPATTTASISSSETTGSIPAAPATVVPAAPEEPKTFQKEDQESVLAVLGDVLPEKGGATSQAWTNSATGYGGMVVPMAQLTKASSSCRELLISFGKDSHKDWYKGKSCNKAGKWQLSDVTAWRTSK